MLWRTLDHRPLLFWTSRLRNQQLVSVEATPIQNVLRGVEGNRSRAAEGLGIEL